ncbi:MAG: pyridoxal phosphate-dependent aminotransferase [Proteobacteria bacterium]|nr:pyridoxal phosphate-dependent aminotransferase [Pseudomonadota bacterium]
MKFTPIIDKLPSTVPFVGPEALERRSGAAIAARIGANESVFGPSPKAVAAMREAAAESWQYGDPENFALKDSLAKHLGVTPQQVVPGEGIDGLLGLVVRLFIDPGDVVATSFGAYPTFNFHVAAAGGRLVTTPYVNDHEDVDGLIALAKREGAKLLYFANPDNPMGTVWPAATVQRLIDSVPEQCLLLLDEAYVEFAPAGTAPAIDVGRRNVLRFRTFSKAHGMAGIRVGYAFGHEEVISAFDKIRNHFGISRVSQAAAIAALADMAWVEDVAAKVASARARIGAIAVANGLTPLPSATNFVTIDCGRDGAYARAIVDGLLGHGIFIRMPGVAPLNRCIRISCGRDADLALLSDALPQVLARLG